MRILCFSTSVPCKIHVIMTRYSNILLGSADSLVRESPECLCHLTCLPLGTISCMFAGLVYVVSQVISVFHSEELVEAKTIT